MYHMKKATVRDLRYDFPKIERALRAGQEIQITKRNRVIARLVPESTPPTLPDFQARLDRIFGDRIVEPSGAELISEDREGR
jgi:antitoxin (DNA-binding transcriptional repressor) of toxin-antitoxin stability system